MINSLKRKKSSTATNGTKNANKKPKTVSNASTNASPEAVVSAFSLDHLIDRPYVEYDSQRDDIGMQF
jgi:hypothetical protein